MAAQHDELARDTCSGPLTRPTPPANDNGGRCAIGSSAFPPDAVAIIEPMPIATNEGGRARRGQWRVRFEPRCPPFVDPLTGWTGGRDPLAHVELRFHDRDAAERYCRSGGLLFRSNAQPGHMQGGGRG
jgi:hypothetical protein